MRKGLPLAPVAGLVLFAAAVVVAGIYFLLPSFLERSVAGSIQDRLNVQSAPEVELERGSLLEVLAGKFSGGKISLGSADLGDVRAERVVVDLDPVDLNLPASILRTAIETEKPLSGALRVEISEGEFSRLVREDLPVRGVELDKGRVLVRSEAPVLGFAVPISVQGSLALRGGALVFEPRRVSALGTPVPGRLREQLLAGANFTYPLRGLPPGARITGVQVVEGRLTLSGKLEHIPVNQPLS